MKRTPITPDLNEFPAAYRSLLTGADVFDSSCSEAARVIFIDRDGGLFLKSAAPGALSREAEMTRFFHSRRFGAEVLDYASADRDWLLTRRVPGEDCGLAEYRAEPERLCRVLAEAFRALHDADTADCPVADRTSEWLAQSESGHRAGNFSPLNDDFKTADEAWRYVEANAASLRTDCLIHGDACLPNVMLDGWRFSGFIDLGNAGIADRHFDLFWTLWSLSFNLKTDRYHDRFLDAYGRDKISGDALRLIGAIEAFT